MRVYLGFSSDAGWDPGGGAYDLRVSGALRYVHDFLEARQQGYVSIVPAKPGYEFTQEMVDAQLAEQKELVTTTSSVNRLPHWVPARPARVGYNGWAHILEVRRRIVRCSVLIARLVDGSETEWRWVWSDFGPLTVAR